MSKGSKRRPQQIDEAEMERRWQMAFGKRRKHWQELHDISWADLRKQRPELFAPYDETTAEHALNSHRKGD